MCFSVTFPDFGENWMKFLYSTKNGRDWFAFKDSNLDNDELSEVSFTDSSLQIPRNIDNVLQNKLESPVG